MLLLARVVVVAAAVVVPPPLLCPSCDVSAVVLPLCLLLPLLLLLLLPVLWLLRLLPPRLLFLLLRLLLLHLLLPLLFFLPLLVLLPSASLVAPLLLLLLQVAVKVRVGMPLQPAMQYASWRCDQGTHLAVGGSVRGRACKRADAHALSSQGTFRCGSTPLDSTGAVPHAWRAGTGPPRPTRWAPPLRGTFGSIEACRSRAPVPTRLL